MFAYRHDLLKALIANGVRLVVLGPHEKLSDLPEFKAIKDNATIDPLLRSFDYSPTTKLLVVGQENVLGNPRHPSVGDYQVIRVMATAVYHVTATRPVDPNWENRGREVQQYELRVKRLDERFDRFLQQHYESARQAGKWKGTSAVHDPVRYWASGVLAYFDAAGQDAAPNDAAHPISSREILSTYDQALYELVAETMAYQGHVDWRFQPR
jgi:hypothetical protein